MSVLLLPYWLIIKRTTFFTANRMYLLGLLIIPFAIPIIANQFSLGVDYFNSGQALIEEYISASPQTSAIVQIKSGNTTPENYALLFYIYLAGVLVFLLRFIYSLAQILSSHLTSTRYHNTKLKLRILENYPTPFAFGRTIYLPKSIKDNADLDLILQHEKSHVQQVHTLDNIMAELACIILWFNPVIYIIKNAIRLNHEYLADRSVLNAGYNFKDYLTLLSDTILSTKYLNPSHTLKDNFLKRRILMMKQSPSKFYKRISYLFIIPLAALLFLAFARPLADNTPARLPFDENFAIKISNAFGNEGPNPITKKMVIHLGVDFRAKNGTPVYATAAGKAIHVAEKGNWGKLIILQHNESFETRYAHLDGFTIDQGETVIKGQLIGYVGSTGLSTGPHLHYEVLKDGKPVNPMDYIKNISQTE